MNRAIIGGIVAGALGVGLYTFWPEDSTCDRPKFKNDAASVEKSKVTAGECDSILKHEEICTCKWKGGACSLKGDDSDLAHTCCNSSLLRCPTTDFAPPK